MLQVAFFRGHRGALATTLLTLIATTTSCLFLLRTLPTQGHTVTGLLLVDRLSLFYCLLNIFTAAIVSAIGFHYLCARLAGQSEKPHHSESYPEAFYILLLLISLGACTLVSANHFASFFLALELISISFYPLLAFSVHGDRSPLRDQMLSLESGFKYLMTSAFATAVGLFGIAMVFTASGSLAFSTQPLTSDLYQAGLVLFLVAVALKLSLVPFHFWTPDVYQGAPTPVTALIATLGKSALVAALLKLVHTLQLFELPIINLLIATLAAASMIIGNLLALRQQNIKRLLAYSSIAHLGYVFVALLLIDERFAREAVSAYLVAYVLTTLSAFSIVSLVADSELPHTPGGAHPLQDHARDPFQRAFYRGLLWRAPVLSIYFIVALLSLAGIPLTLGFFGKFYLFSAGIQGQQWWLLIALIAGSALGLYYYLGLILDLLKRQDSAVAGDNRETPEKKPDSINMLKPAGCQKTSVTDRPESIALSGWLVLLLLTILLLGFGVYPSPLINWIIAL
ncbi:NADH-quinone oxidoreductase subunit N [Microbulbifer aggregans]|uniref:NADH-quinone oxidoreductase subunit N n=1 Tax=Microbulbifer aggregans TaxID=1769779 RepID=UPI001CFF39D6|nr:NADH-quinone oxidoreductase subunit N [Microbulbifer aggregans]